MSPESEMIAERYRSMKETGSVDAPDALDIQRLKVDGMHDLASEPTDVNYEEVNCPGTVRPAIWCKPATANPHKVILYAHGGGGFSGSPASHRKMVGHLAKLAGSYALLLDYHLVPENSFRLGIEDMVKAYQWLLEQGFAANNIITGGDSAGARQAISVVLKLREIGVDGPAGVVVISPHIDMEGTGQTYESNVGKCALGTGAPHGFQHTLCALYLGGTSPKDPFANALYADFKGFPPLYIAVAALEVFLSDAEQLADVSKKAGVDTTLVVSPEMQHAFQLMAGRAPEADESIEDIARWMKSKMGT